jgi:hypothetical protein
MSGLGHVIDVNTAMALSPEDGRVTPWSELALFCETETFIEALLPFIALVLAFAMGLGLGVFTRGLRTRHP